MRLLPAALAVLLAMSGTVLAQGAPVSDCDRLAAWPGTVAGTSGVDFNAIDVPAALAACQASLQQHPGEPRFMAQYARALQRGGDDAAAAKAYAWSAADSYPPAQTAYGLMLRDGAGVTADADAGRRLLEQAAAAGYEPAQRILQMPEARGTAPNILASVFTAPAGALSLSRAQERAAAGVEPLPPPQLDAATIDPVALGQQMLALAEGLSPLDYDLDALAASFGGDPLVAFAFVRDGIGYEAYPGVLRGAEGTLYSRAGNAFDRSLLLQALLQRIGVTSRFVFGTLDENDAGRLYRRMFAAAAEGASMAAPATANGTLRGLPERLLARAARDYGVIRPALGQRLAATAAPEPDTIVVELRSHVWLEASIDGDWLALDTAFADAAPGDSFATVQERRTELAPAVFQTVAIRLVGEGLSGEALVEKPLVEARLRAADLGIAQLFALFAPESAFEAVGGEVSDTLGQAVDVLGGDSAPQTDRWTPVLWIDGEAVAGEPISIEPQEAGTANTALSALWLEFEIGLPDGRRDVSRRVLLDRVTPADRAVGRAAADALAPLEWTDRGPVALLTLHNIWISGSKHNLREFAEAAAYLADFVTARVTDDDSLARLSPGELLWPTALGNFLLPIASDHLIIPALNDSADLRFYPAAPRVFIFSQGPAPALGPEAVAVVIDLHRDSVRGVAAAGASQEAVAERQLWFGLLEGALETELAERHMAGFDAGEVELVSASALLGSGVRIFAPDDAAALAAAVPDPARAGPLAAALANGSTLIVPEAVLAGGPLVWWQLGPDGAVRAVGDPGLGMSKVLKPGGGRGTVVSGNSGGVYEVNPDGTSRDVTPGRGGGKGGGGGRQGPRGRSLMEYIQLLLSVPIPNAVSYAVLGLEVGGTLLYVGALLIEQ